MRHVAVGCECGRTVSEENDETTLTCECGRKYIVTVTILSDLTE